MARQWPPPEDQPQSAELCAPTCQSQASIHKSARGRHCSAATLSQPYKNNAPRTSIQLRELGIKTDEACSKLQVAVSDARQSSLVTSVCCDGGAIVADAAAGHAAGQLQQPLLHVVVHVVALRARGDRRDKLLAVVPPRQARQPALAIAIASLVELYATVGLRISRGRAVATIISSSFKRLCSSSK